MTYVVSAICFPFFNCLLHHILLLIYHDYLLYGVDWNMANILQLYHIVQLISTVVAINLVPKQNLPVKY